MIASCATSLCLARLFSYESPWYWIRISDWIG